MVTRSFWLDLCGFVWKDGFRRGWIFKDCGDIWIRLLRGRGWRIGVYWQLLCISRKYIKMMTHWIYLHHRLDRMLNHRSNKSRANNKGSYQVLDVFVHNFIIYQSSLFNLHQVPAQRAQEAYGVVFNILPLRNLPPRTSILIRNCTKVDHINNNKTRKQKTINNHRSSSHRLSL